MRILTEAGNVWAIEQSLQVSTLANSLSRMNAIAGGGGSISMVLGQEETRLVARQLKPENERKFGFFSFLDTKYADWGLNAAKITEALQYLKDRMLVCTLSGRPVGPESLMDNTQWCVVCVANADSEEPRLLATRMGGYQIDQPWRPSGDLPTHLMAHAQGLFEQPPTTTLVHAHPPMLTLASRLEGVENSENLLERLLDQNIVTPQVISGIDFVRHNDGTLDGREIFRRYVSGELRSDVVIEEFHGVYLRGRDLYECARKIELLETAATQCVAAQSTEKKFRRLSHAQVAKIRGW